MRCTATGDAMITKRLPADGEYAGFSAVRDFIMQGDFRFSNLETTVHNFESCAGARSGGSWLRMYKNRHLLKLPDKTFCLARIFLRC
ncbi:MAG: CapA family protein [Lentisphaerae bacterium]|nr:CapA family protein [Lentisphaerota bacterium]